MKKGHIGIELGTRHLRICTKEKEQFLRVKNMIAIDENGKVAAAGNEAFLMYEKEPHEIQILFPVAGGVIGDYTNMRLLLSVIFRKYFRHFRKYSVGVAAPEDITVVERRAFYDLVWESAGRLKDVSLYSKPMLAAVGCGMDISRPCGNMLIDCGAGTTELSVLSLGGIVKSRLLKYGGNQIDQWIVHRMKRQYNIDIGKKSAERLKIQYAKNSGEKDVTVKGRDLISGLPRKMTVPSSVAEEKVKNYFHDVAREAKAVLEAVPPELASDIMVHGIYITGGGSLFPKAAGWMEEELGISVCAAPGPEESVIRGLRTWME